MSDAAKPPVRILVVEDSEDDYQLLQQRLRSAAFEASTERVEDEHGMTRALASGAWDLVISDHNLPRFSSLEALALLRGQASDIPFIIVSGMIGEDVAVQAMQSGADDYVMKSNMARLIPAIERSLKAVAERRARKASERRLALVAANIPGMVLRLEWRAEEEAIHFPFASEGSARLCGHPSADLTADPRHLLDLIDPGDRARLHEAIEESAGLAANLRWEGRARDPSGETRWWLLAAAYDATGGAATAWDGILLDVTPEKQAVEDLRQSREQLAELTAHLEHTKETERAIIAREIHDELGGLLTGLKADVAWLKKQSISEPRARDKLRDMESLLDEVVLVSKRIAMSLRPAILDQGLNAALEWQAQEFQKRAGIACRFRTNDENLELESARATGLFRVFQEALTNVARHAQAKEVSVQLFATEKLVTLEIQDDGIGVKKQDLAKPRSFGVRGMHERVRHLGGWLEVSGAPGRGTTIMLSIPRNGREARTRT